MLMPSRDSVCLLKATYDHTDNTFENLKNLAPVRELPTLQIICTIAKRSLINTWVAVINPRNITVVWSVDDQTNGWLNEIRRMPSLLSLVLLNMLVDGITSLRAFKRYRIAIPCQQFRVPVY